MKLQMIKYVQCMMCMLIYYVDIMLCCKIEIYVCLRIVLDRKFKNVD
jgi:hypothetical protein